MKNKTFVIVLFVIMIFVACAPTNTAVPRADNFSFIFRDTPCGQIPMNVLDTATGTLVHTPLGDTNSITISLQLTDDELESIYQKAISIGFFEYPSKFVVPDDQVLGYEIPASSYELSMTNGERVNSVSWTDDAMTKPSYAKADQLRELMRLINNIIQSHPEVQQLPEPNELCA